MQALKKWLTSYNITTHSVTGAAVFLVGAFHAVPQFHALVIKAYKGMPGWEEEIVLAALAVYAWYRKGAPSAAAPVDGTNCVKLNG